MSAFRNVAAKVVLPGRTMILQSWVFADEWADKPKGAVCVGLRLMSEADKTRARGEAERFASATHPDGGPNFIDCYNDALLRQIVALGVTDPNDVRRPPPIFKLPEDEVAIALTTRGARHVFDEIHRYEFESSPLNAEATDDEIETLANMLLTDGLDGLAPRKVSSVRKFLRYALDEIESREDDAQG